MSGKEPDVLPNGTPLRCACGKELTQRWEKYNKYCRQCMVKQAMSRNLWIDDEKPAPQDPEWAVAKTFDTAVHMLQNHRYDVVAIDHDLGDDHRTGYDILCMMERGELPTPDAISVISWNAAGANRMMAVINKLTGVRNLGWDLSLASSGWRPLSR